MPLRLEPALEAVVVDVANCARALTRENQWVRFILFCAPAESTLNGLLAFFYNISGRPNDVGLLQLLLEEFSRRQVHLLTAEVLYSESDTAQLDCIELLDLVVKLALGVF